MGIDFRKWVNVASFVLPVVAGIVGGKAGALIPIIADGIQEAAAIPGASSGDKKAYVEKLVRDGVAGATAAQGKVDIDPDTAVSITRDVFSVIDKAHEVAHKHAV